MESILIIKIFELETVIMWKATL